MLAAANHGVEQHGVGMFDGQTMAVVVVVVTLLSSTTMMTTVGRTGGAAIVQNVTFIRCSRTPAAGNLAVIMSTDHLTHTPVDPVSHTRSDDGDGPAPMNMHMHHNCMHAWAA